MTTIPRIISVDDHVVEPPDLWTSRLPAKYQDRCPRVERDTAEFNFEGGVFSFEKGVEGGEMCDWWLYDDLVYPFPKLSAAAGFDELDVVPVTFAEIHPAGWKQAARLTALAERPVDVSVWIMDEACGGDGRGRLIPLTLIPLWDPVAAAAEIHRCANKGSFAVAFSENPFPLGLPSIHDKDRFWDPFFVACQEADTIVNMHIGSSSKMPTTSPDAPFSVSSTITFANAMGSMCDYILSGMFVRFPKLKIAYAEGQVGWMPYVVERMDKIWAERGDASFGIDLPEPPSSYIPGHVWGCIFDDEIGLKNRDVIGLDQICFEVDFPHADTTYPHTLDVATKICREAGLDDDEVYKLMRGNAIKAFGLERFGITE